MTYRKQMLAAWEADIRENHKLPITDPFMLKDNLASDTTIQVWVSQGLPGDGHSVQNGMLTVTAMARGAAALDEDDDGSSSDDDDEVTEGHSSPPKDDKFSVARAACITANAADNRGDTAAAEQQPTAAATSCAMPREC